MKIKTNDDFSDPELLGEEVRIPKDKCYTITKEMLKRVPQGRNIYLRVYPWMRVSEKVRGKTIGISDVKIKGILTEAPTAPAAKKSVSRRPASKSSSTTKPGAASKGSAAKPGTASRPGTAATKGSPVKKSLTIVRKK